MRDCKRCCNATCFKESDECEGNVDVDDEENDYWIHSCEKHKDEYISALEKELENANKASNSNI